MARCMATRTSTPWPDSPCSQMYRSGTSSTTVTATAARTNTQRGRDETRVTTGQPTQAIEHADHRQLGVVPEGVVGEVARCRGTRPCPRPPVRRRPPVSRRRPPPRPGPSAPTRAGGRRARSRCGTSRAAARGRCRPPGSDDRRRGRARAWPTGYGPGTRAPCHRIPAPCPSASARSDAVDGRRRRVRPGPRRRRPPRSPGRRRARTRCRCRAAPWDVPRWRASSAPPTIVSCSNQMSFFFRAMPLLPVTPVGHVGSDHHPCGRRLRHRRATPVAGRLRPDGRGRLLSGAARHSPGPSGTPAGGTRPSSGPPRRSSGPPPPRWPPAAGAPGAGPPRSRGWHR